MGGSSKSSNATTNNTSTTTVTNNKSNSAAFNGDMSGHVLSGIENSTINMTDGGAVNKALEAMFENSKEAFSFGEEALDINEAVSKAALSSNQSTAYKAMSSNQSTAYKAMNSNQAITNKALNFADGVMGDFSGVLDEAFRFGREAMNSAETATDSALGVAKNLSLDSDAATARDANKNMMYTTVAIAVAVAIIAFKK